jgi:hypothetical protein
MIFLCIIIGLIWYISGCYSFIYWWTMDFSFTKREFPVCACAGLIGPLAFIVGFLIHGIH